MSALRSNMGIRQVSRQPLRRSRPDAGLGERAYDCSLDRHGSSLWTMVERADVAALQWLLRSNRTPSAPPVRIGITIPEQPRGAVS